VDAARSALEVVGFLLFVGVVGAVVVALPVAVLLAVRQRGPYPGRVMIAILETASAGHAVPRWRQGLAIGALIGGVVAVYSLALLVAGGMGLRTTAPEGRVGQADAWLVLVFLGALLFGSFAVKSGAKATYWRGVLKGYRGSGETTPGEITKLASAQSEREAFTACITLPAIVMSIAGAAALLSVGTPWRRALAASLVLALAVAFVSVIAFHRGRGRGRCSACSEPLTLVKVADHPLHGMLTDLRCLDCEPSAARPVEPGHADVDDVPSGVAAQLTTEGATACPRCGRENRVPAGRSRTAARCGACKMSLFDVSAPVHGPEER
jgi:hypothetical protein